MPCGCDSKTKKRIIVHYGDRVVADSRRLESGGREMMDDAMQAITKARSSQTNAGAIQFVNAAKRYLDQVDRSLRME